MVKEIYKISADFPQSEAYGLTNQIRRSAISIPSNIAEGFLRQHTNEFVHFLYISLGSCGELDTQLIIAEELRYMQRSCVTKFQEKLDVLMRMIRSLIKGLRAKHLPAGRQGQTLSTKH